jgi:ABC-type arginine transport system ATPase subunit
MARTGKIIAMRNEAAELRAAIAQRDAYERGLLTDAQLADFDKQNAALDAEGEARILVAEFLACRLDDLAGGGAPW